MPAATVDTAGPDTAITSGPSGAITGTSATWGFSSETDATFQCALDGGAWGTCASPTSFDPVAPGAHTFFVRGVDRAGNSDPSPASRSIVVPAPPEPSGDAAAAAAPGAFVVAPSTGPSGGSGGPGSGSEIRISGSALSIAPSGDAGVTAASPDR